MRTGLRPGTLTSPEADQDVEHHTLSLVAGERTEWNSLRTVWQLLAKLNIRLTRDPATGLLGIYPEELSLRASVQSRVPRSCPNSENCADRQSVRGNERWSIPTRGSPRRNRTSLSERSQPEKATCCVIPAPRPSGKGKTVETIKNNQWVPWIGGEGGTTRLLGAVTTLRVTCTGGYTAQLVQAHRMFGAKNEP